MKVPSFEELFGLSDYRTSDEYRTVLSPAAYLVDLLLLKDISQEYYREGYDGTVDHLASPNYLNTVSIKSATAVDDKIEERRNDIRNIKLNRKNTTTLLPYLDIVNEVLEYHITNNDDKDAARDAAGLALFSENYPIHLPMNLHQQFANLTMDFFKVNMVKFLKLYGMTGSFDWLSVAREYLKISENEADVLTHSVIEIDPVTLARTDHLDELVGLWGITVSPVNVEEIRKNLQDPENFKKQAGINNRQLQELLFQNLSMAERASQAQNNFYINSGIPDSHTFLQYPYPREVTNGTETDIVDGYALMKKDTGGTVSDLDVEHFDRIHRFIRLSKKMDWRYADCDLVIRNCCGGKIDTDAIKTVAIVKFFEKRFELPIDVICALVTDIKTFGKGIESEDDPIADDLFSRTFGFEFNPTSMPTSPSLEYALQGGLEVNKKDFDFLVALLDETLSTEPLSAAVSSRTHDFEDLKDISFIYRIAKCAQFLEITVEELVKLCEIIDLNRTVNELEVFDILHNSHLDTGASPVDPLNKNVVLSMVYLYNIDNEYTDSVLTIIQQLVAIVDWLNGHEMTVNQFEFICRRDVEGNVDDVLSKGELVSLFGALHDEYDESAFSPKSLLNKVVNDDMAARLFSVLTPSFMSICNEDGVIQDNLESVSEKQKDYIRKALLSLVDFHRTIDVYDFDKCKFEFLSTEDPSDVRNGLNCQSVEALSKLYCIGAIEPVVFNEYDRWFDDIEFLANPKPGVFPDANQLYRINHRLDLFSGDTPNPDAFVTRIKEAEDCHSSYLESHPFPPDTEVTPISMDTWKNIYSILVAKVKGYTSAKVAIESDLKPVDFERTIDVFSFKECGFEVVETGNASDPTEGLCYQSVEALATLHCIGAIKAVEYDETDRTFKEIEFDANQKPWLLPDANQLYRIDNTLDLFAADRPDPVSFLARIEKAADCYTTYMTSHPFPGGGTGTPVATEVWQQIYSILFATVKKYETALKTNSAVDAVVDTIRENGATQRDIVLTQLTSELDLPGKTVEILINTVFCTPDENPAMGIYRILAPACTFYSNPENASTYPDLGCLHVGFRRLQQFVLLVKKSKLTTREVDVFVNKMKFSGNLPENLKLPDEFLDTVTAAYTEPSGDIVLFANNAAWTEMHYARYAKATHELVIEGLLSDYQAPEIISDQSNKLAVLDAAVTDTKTNNAYLFGENDFIDVSKKERKAILGNWARVDNYIQNSTEQDLVHGAFATDMHIYLFSNNQYYRYSKDPASDNAIFFQNDYVDEGYPLRTRKHWNDQEGAREFRIDHELIRKIDAIFKGVDKETYLFTGKNFTSVAPDKDEVTLKATPQKWGVIRNAFLEPDAKITAALVSGIWTYLFCEDQYIRYENALTPGNTNFCVEEEYPRLISDWNDHETICKVDPAFFITPNPAYPPNYPEAPDPKQPEKAIDAAFQGVNDTVYFFQNNAWCGSKGSAAAVTGVVNEKWGKVRNNIQENGVVDAAFVPLPKQRYYLGTDLSGTSPDKMYPCDRQGADWIEDASTDYGDPVKMAGEVYENGLGGKPPLVAETFNWLLYDIETFLSMHGLVGEPVVLKGHGAIRMAAAVSICVFERVLMKNNL